MTIFVRGLWNLGMKKSSSVLGLENETEWEGPESRTEAKARKIIEKAEKPLWKQLEDLDIRDRKAEQKAAKKASDEKKRKQAAETEKAAKARTSSKNTRSITSFFKAKSKEKQPLTIESHHVTDWEMEDVDPNSVWR